MKAGFAINANESPLVLFTSKDGAVTVPATLERETVWLSQGQMSALFGKERSVITKHIQNAMLEGEVDEKSNVHFLHIPRSDKPVAFYNLDVIISVGYRVKSQRGVEFRGPERPNFRTSPARRSPSEAG